MSKEEIKCEINKVLDALPDKTLEDLLTFLQNFSGKQTMSLTDKATLDKILIEDKHLLQRLAQ